MNLYFKFHFACVEMILNKFRVGVIITEKAKKKYNIILSNYIINVEGGQM